MICSGMLRAILGACALLFAAPSLPPVLPQLFTPVTSGIRHMREGALRWDSPSGNSLWDGQHATCRHGGDREAGGGAEALGFLGLSLLGFHSRTLRPGGPGGTRLPRPLGRSCSLCLWGPRWERLPPLPTHTRRRHLPWLMLPRSLHGQLGPAPGGWGRSHREEGREIGGME